MLPDKKWWKMPKLKILLRHFGWFFKHCAGVLILPNENLQEVYDGIWGYNAVISTASISCVFFVFNYMSITFGMINLLASIGIQYALRATLVLQVRKSKHSVWKLLKKSHSSFWKTEACSQTVLPDRSYFIGQKLVKKAKFQKFKCDILDDF